MQDFEIGPFEYSVGREVRLGDELAAPVTLRYGSQQLGMHTLPSNSTRTAVVDAFGDELAALFRQVQAKHGAATVYVLDEPSGKNIASFPAVGGLLPGMTAGLPNDSSKLWLVSSSKPTRCKPLNSLDELVIQVSHYVAPTRSWIAGLLPDEVLTANADEWRAPSAWELRHVVGEGSFTGVTVAQAAEMAGVAPQNFRKYIARDGAASRQAMSFAMWHLLLHRLQIQRLAW